MTKKENPRGKYTVDVSVGQDLFHHSFNEIFTAERCYARAIEASSQEVRLWDGDELLKSAWGTKP